MVLRRSKALKENVTQLTMLMLSTVFEHSTCTYPVVKEDHQKAKADEDNQCHKQNTSHHGEVILQSTQNITAMKYSIIYCKIYFMKLRLW